MRKAITVGVVMLAMFWGSNQSLEARPSRHDDRGRHDRRHHDPVTLEACLDKITAEDSGSESL